MKNSLALFTIVVISGIIGCATSGSKKSNEAARLPSSVGAQAAQGEATISCTCQNWVMGEEGMHLVPGATGTSTVATFAESFARETQTARWHQSKDVVAGYSSVTPSFLQSRSDFAKIFVDGGKALNYIINECKTVYARQEGNVACGVAITFPIGNPVR